jgi:NifU-like protein
VVYPEKVVERLKRLQNAQARTSGSAVGTEANFSCGSFIRFSLSIDIESNSVTDATFTSNGCGFMLAAADVLAESVRIKGLANLHGLDDGDLHKQIEQNLGVIPTGRRECLDACINALRAAFADFRSRQIEEFRGEKALICTCFGLTEETIELQIAERSLRTVEEVAQACNAGTGCGSCRMLIQEMLDTTPI